MSFRCNKRILATPPHPKLGPYDYHMMVVESLFVGFGLPKSLYYDGCLGFGLRWMFRGWRGLISPRFRGSDFRIQWFGGFGVEN